MASIEERSDWPLPYTVRWRELGKQRRESYRTKSEARAAKARKDVVEDQQRRGEAATDLALQLNSSGKTSYHLRRLTAVGLVLEDAERGNARDRWWRAAHTGSTWSSVDFLEDPDTNVAAEWLTGHVARTHARWLNEFVEARSDLSPQWLEATDMSDYRVTLTPERLRKMIAEVHAVVNRYHDDEPVPALSR